MDKTEWGALNDDEKKIAVAGLMGAEDIDRCAASGDIMAYWPEGDEGRGEGWMPIPEYTTDRNACALVLDADKIKRNWAAFANRCMSELGIEHGTARWAAFWAGLCADPDTICYCAVKAVSDAEDRT